LNRDQYVAVCAWDAESLRPLAEAGRRIADETGCLLKIMLFAEVQKQCGENARLLEYVFECAKETDAEMNVYYTERPMEHLMKDSSDCLIISGAEERGGQLRRLLPEKRLVIVE